MQTPLRDIVTALNIEVAEIGEPHYDDPSLALLFSQLRAKTLQTAKGTSEISGKSEFNFVLQMARVFCRMGVCIWFFHLGNLPHAFCILNRLPCACFGSGSILVFRTAICDYT